MSGMLFPPGPIRVLVATKPVDFRKGMNGLAALVQEQLRADPFSGVIYCFRSKRADRVKLIFWDGTGLCLFAKRLEDSKFCWPRIEDGVMRLSAAQLSDLVEGLTEGFWKPLRELVTMPSRQQLYAARPATSARPQYSKTRRGREGASGLQNLWGWPDPAAAACCSRSPNVPQ